MTADEWYAKRDRLAFCFDVESKDVPPEAVWFISERGLQPADIKRAWEVWQEVKENGR